MATPPVKTDTMLEMRRTFNASRARLYEAWTDPKMLARWFHPHASMTTTVKELSLEPGGRYRFVMHGSDDHVIGGVYQEIVPQEKLVFTWQWESEEETAEMLITLSFHKVDEEQTELVLIHERFPSIEERDSHEVGWIGTFDVLNNAL